MNFFFTKNQNLQLFFFFFFWGGGGVGGGDRWTDRPKPICQFSSSRTTTVQNYFEIHALMYMLWTSSIYDHFNHYLTPVTLTFNLPEKMFQMALLPLEGNNSYCAKLI